MKGKYSGAGLGRGVREGCSGPGVLLDCPIFLSCATWKVLFSLQTSSSQSESTKDTVIL